MGEKRRDSKGRILRTGESQRADGRYVYVYLDNQKKQRFIYSWKLEETDKLPKGKRPCESLREKEKELNKNIINNVYTDNKLTVIKLVKKYLKQKQSFKEKTKTIYEYVTRVLENEEIEFGSKLVKDVKISDVKQWFISLQNEKRFSYNTILKFRSVLKPAFKMALDDNLIFKNPFDFTLSNIIANDTKNKSILNEEEERFFLDFVKNDIYQSKYYDGICVLFNTGLRISEFSGLTVSDIDFKNRKINVTHQLIKNNGKYLITTTKSKSGVRSIPMNDITYKCLKNIVKNREKSDKSIIGYDGKEYKDFLYLDVNGNPRCDLSWQKSFRSLYKKYNQINKDFPKVTPHTCRHTFCSRMILKGINPKVLQYIMGHSSIKMTLDIYTHISYDEVDVEFSKITF